MFRDRLHSLVVPLVRVLAPPPGAVAPPPGVSAAAVAQLQPPPTRELQLLLRNQYRLWRHLGAPLPQIDEVGFRVYSEADEDGILHYIFSLVGTTNKRLVDIGAAGVSGSNSANLLINDGWIGLLLEGDAERVEALRRFYVECPDTSHYPPRCVSAWLTADNINDLVRDAGVSGDIDLLCIDIDGIDYWVWRALDAVSPRVVVVEYQCIWGPERSVTVPYDPKFKPGFDGRYGIYNSASLAAFVKLARSKGYRLVGSHRYGYNAFFVRDDVGADCLPEVPAESCFRHPFTRWAMDTFLPKIEKLAWEEV